MTTKKEKLREYFDVLKWPHVTTWYEKNLETKPQIETMDSLISGVESKELTLKEALFLAFIVGYQWEIKFEGVP